MLTEPGGPFIDVSKINLGKYAGRPALAKVRETMQMNAIAASKCVFNVISSLCVYVCVGFV